MNLSLKKENWYLELMIIVIAILAINLSVALIGFNNVLSIITGQMINLAGFVSLLFLARFHIKNNSNQLLYYFKNKLLISDLLLVALLIISGRICYNILIETEFVKLFNLDIFKNKQFFISHLSRFEAIIIFSISNAVLLLGVIAEELYFRCYLFDIQHKRFKNYTWIVNGFSWSIYHVFSLTNFLAFLPTCLMYSYIYQRRRNICITIFAHLINNFIAFYPMIKAYMTH
ncbi:MAG: CPBP family intramembrane metalloprotease [Bacteroidota bacterium]|nr:hypothetical protein [Odoribacter sp.]MDP3643694.1 CPBP family intramembrane metalloprotease [Bacteroidota bacterium]